MEKFSPELIQAQTEALEIQKRAEESREKRGESGNLTSKDYENAATSTPSLEDFLQEPSSDYSRIIKQASENEFEDRHVLRANHSSPWSFYDGIEDLQDRADPKILELFKNTISGNTLCELGGASGRMETLAATNNAGLYINIDKYPSGTKDDGSPIDPTIGHVVHNKYEDRLTGAVLIEGVHATMSVRSDMLDFVSRLKNESVNIVINGIDGDLIPVKEYHKSLAEEILRVTKENGVIFGNGSACLTILCNLIQSDSLLSAKYQIIKRDKGVVVIYKK